MAPMAVITPSGEWVVLVPGAFAGPAVSVIQITLAVTAVDLGGAVSVPLPLLGRADKVIERAADSACGP